MAKRTKIYQTADLTADMLKKGVTVCAKGHEQEPYWHFFIKPAVDRKSTRLNSSH